MRMLCKNLVKKGFSLVEMLVVIAIIGIIVGLALPSVDQWYKIRRVHDAALSLASTFENMKVVAGTLRKPVVVGFVDDLHFGVYDFSGQLMPVQYQPESSSGYKGEGVNSPWGGERLKNPIPSRIKMSIPAGINGGITTKTIVIMPNGSLQRFTGGDFTANLEPLGDIFRVTFVDTIIQQEGDQNMKAITSWRVDIQPSGEVIVKKLHDEG